MAGELYPVAGCRFYIGDEPMSPVDETGDPLEAEDFDSIVWTEVDGYSQMGAFGDAAGLITTNLINRGRAVKQKGTFNAGSMENVFAVVSGDDGQEDLIAAAHGRQNWPFRIVMNDGDPEATPELLPGERLFVGLPMSAQEQGGDANTVRNLSATIEINSNIVVVDPVEDV